MRDLLHVEMGSADRESTRSGSAAPGLASSGADAKIVDNRLMRRADRLFQIVQIIRRGRIVTARRLADELKVSERTVYRDIADLVASGVPIRGEAGVGYAMAGGYDLPPLMFTVEELEALVLGARMVESWCGAELAAAARDVLAKVDQVLPRSLAERIDKTALFVPDFGWTVPGAEMLAELRLAMRSNRKARIAYVDVAGESTERVIHPLGVFFWGAVATLGAWCELRSEFRNFRLDRIAGIEVLDAGIVAEPGHGLQDYYLAMSER